MIVVKKKLFIYGDDRAKLNYIYKYFPAGNWSKFPTFVRGPLGGAGFFSIHVGLICAFLREGPLKGFSLFWKE